jgi:alkylation response protein AidB-like acyl-CoA dehydrogenase
MEGGQQHFSAEDEAQILEAVSKWLERDVRPHASKYELADEYPKEMADQMAELGLFGATIPVEYGGLGLSSVTYTKIVARVCEVWMSLSGIFNTHLLMAKVLERGGTEEQKRKYLPKFASGEMRGGLGLTEPDAGTDVQSIRTRAEKRGDVYVVNGRKTWITNSYHGNCILLVAKTDPSAEPPRKGISVFIAEKGNGFTASKLKKLGYRGVDSCEIVFEDFEVPAANLIGAEGTGMSQVLGGLELGRINIAARGIGIAKAALDAAVAYAQQRKTFGKPIAQHQAIQLKLGEMATRYQAAKLLTEDAARIFDAGQRCDMEAGMAKYFASEAAFENAHEAMRIHGGYGYSPEYPVERLYRDAPLLCIGEGTNEMQRIIIARQLVERNKV